MLRPRYSTAAGAEAPLTRRAPEATPAALHGGHRSGDVEGSGERRRQGDDPQVGGIAADRLRSIIERIERLEEERKALGNDIKDIFSEAKSAGFDVKVIRAIIRIRKQEPADVEEQESLLDVYRRALGM